MKSLPKFIAKIVLFISLLVISACNTNPEQIFSFEIIDDADLPMAEITNIYAENNMSYDYVIEYTASDMSGISDIELYIDDEVAPSSYVTYHNDEILWRSELFSGELNFKLKVKDVLGKIGWSQAYMYNLKKINFEQVSLSYIIRDVKKFSDGSMWLVSNDKLLKYDHGVEQEISLPVEDWFFYDIFRAENGDMYASLMQAGSSNRGKLFRYRNGSWDQMSNSNYTYYYMFIEKGDGTIYALSRTGDDIDLVELSTGELIVIDLPSAYSGVYQIGIYSDGELCFSDSNGLKKLVDGNWEYINENDNLRHFQFDSYYNMFHYGGSDYIYFNDEVIAEFDYFIKDTTISKDDRYWAVFGYSIVTHKDGETMYLLDDYFHNLPSNFIPKKVEVSATNDVYIVGGGELYILKENQYNNF